MSVVLQAELPEDVWAALQAAGYTTQKLLQEALQHSAFVLYARRVLTLEQAARLAGMPLWDFIPAAGEQGIPVADYDADEVGIELKTARWVANTPDR